MSGSKRHPPRDLMVVLGLAVVAGLALVLPVPSSARAILAAPLALVLPGYALSAALFLPGEVDRGLRSVLTVIFTAGTISLGGLVLQTVIALDTAVYACLLLIATVGAVAIALRRRATSLRPLPPPFSLPRVGMAPIAGFVAALALAAVAVAVASAGQHRQLAHEDFTALWILPRGTGPTFSTTVGVQNQLGSPQIYALRTAQRGRPLRSWRFRLNSGERWHGSVPASDIVGEAPVTATLFRDGRPYQRVALHPGGEA